MGAVDVSELPDVIIDAPVQAIASPCVNICRIGADRLCEGCRRTIDEIGRWTSRPRPSARR